MEAERDVEGVERVRGVGGLTATDVGGKLACVLIKLHPQEWRQTERRWGGVGGLVVINVVQSKRAHTKKHPLWSEQAA